MSLDLHRSIVIEIDGTEAVVGARKVKDALGSIDSATKNVGASGTASFNTLGRSVSGLTRLLPALAAGFSAVKLADYVKDAALLAARYETLGASVLVVGRNAGYTGQNIAYYETMLRKTGITAIESRASIASMAAANMDLAKSSQLARIAQDAAVIGNINSSEAFQRLVYGIKSAQVEILRNIGINVNFETSYKKLADQLGKTSQELTEAEKLQARMNLVVSAGADIAGTYEASMEAAGKKLQSTARYAEDAKVKLGQIFQPTLIAFVDAYTESLKFANEQLGAFIGYLDKFNSQADVSGQSMETLARRYKEQAEIYKSAEAAQQAMLKGKTGEEQNQIMRTQRWREYAKQLASAEETMRNVRREMALITETDKNQSREAGARRQIKSTASQVDAPSATAGKASIAAANAAKRAYDQMIADGKAAAATLDQYWSDYEDARVASVADGLEARREAEADALQLRTEFADKFRETVVGETEFQIEQLRAQGEAYKAAGADRVAVETWVAQETLKLSRDWSSGAIRGLRDYADTASDAASQVESAITSGFKGMEDALVEFVKTGKLEFSDFADSVISDLARIAIQQSITGPLASAAGGFLSNLFSPSVASVGAPKVGYAKGGVPGAPSLSAYANTIVSKPTIFPFARGVGLMGEAGPEAIMPLKRGPDGTLGVRGGGSNVVVNVIESPGNGGKTQQRQENGVNILDVMVEQIKSSIASDINRGNGVVPQAITKSYGLSRAPGAY